MCGNMFNMIEIEITERYENFLNYTNMDRP